MNCIFMSISLIVWIINKCVKLLNKCRKICEKRWIKNCVHYNTWRKYIRRAHLLLAARGKQPIKIPTCLVCCCCCCCLLCLFLFTMYTYQREVAVCLSAWTRSFWTENFIKINKTKNTNPSTDMRVVIRLCSLSEDE